MMDPRTDLCDEAMALRWGHVINEIPELWNALRKFEIENRSTSLPACFSIKDDLVSVQRVGNMTRIRIGDTWG